MADLPFSCRCGQVKGILTGAGPDTGNHVRCFCGYCRAAAIYTGAADPELNGVTLFQTTADKVRFTSGKDQLGVFSFGPKNILRWQAKCCGAALFTTLRSPKFPLAALITERLDQPEAIGPVKSQAFVPQKNGKTRHENKAALIGGTMLRVLASRLSGRWKTTPFFDLQTLAPVAPVTIVSPEARRALIRQTS